MNFTNIDMNPYGMPPWYGGNPFDEFPDVVFPEGILLKEEYFMLLEHAQGKSLCVDIGTFKGLSAAIMSLVAKRVVTIDVYESFNGLRIEQVAKGLVTFPNIELVKGDANEVASTFKEKPDLLFIDAQHTRREVRDNFNAWFPLLKPGGEVLFHDYQAYHHDVVNFVREEVLPRGDVKVIDKQGTIVAFVKLGCVLYVR